MYMLTAVHGLQGQMMWQGLLGFGRTKRCICTQALYLTVVFSYHEGCAWAWRPQWIVCSINSWCLSHFLCNNKLFAKMSGTCPDLGWGTLQAPKWSEPLPGLVPPKMHQPHALRTTVHPIWGGTGRVLGPESLPPTHKRIGGVKPPSPAKRHPV